MEFDRFAQMRCFPIGSALLPFVDRFVDVVHSITQEHRSEPAYGSLPDLANILQAVMVGNRDAYRRSTWLRHGSPLYRRFCWRLQSATNVEEQ